MNATRDIMNVIIDSESLSLMPQVFIEPIEVGYVLEVKCGEVVGVREIGEEQSNQRMEEAYKENREMLNRMILWMKKDLGSLYEDREAEVADE